MNIFWLHDTPHGAARLQCDKHVVKMILETAQLLSSVHHLTDSPEAGRVYKLTHKNHPCAVWARESRENYLWLFEHLDALLQEYTHRYGKIHKTTAVAAILAEEPDLPDLGLTEPPQCVYDDCTHPDVVQAYRLYYRERANEIDMRWTKRPVPDFMEAS